MVSVPTTKSAKQAGEAGLTGGLPAGIGALAGKSVLGRGAGTAIGGILGASATSGSTRERTAEMAVFTGLTELGGSGSGGSSNGGRGRM